MTMVEFFLLTLYLAIPAYIANMMPIVAARYKWLPFLDAPIDGGATLRGKRVFGANKTWRGLVVGGVFGGLAGAGQFLLDMYEIVSIDQLDSLAVFVGFGVLGGIGALL